MSFATEGQVTYNLEPAVAAPGMIADLEDYSVESYPAVEVINPGRMCQLASDGVSVQQVQGTSSSATTPPNKVIGFSVLKTARSPSDSTFGTSDPQAYQIGEMVPVMKRGKLYVEWKSSSAQPIMTNAGLRVFESSTTATDRGKLTANSGSTTGGSEVVAVPGGVRLRGPALPTSGSLALCEVNLPGSSA